MKHPQRRLFKSDEPVQLVDNEALMAQSCVVGALREMFINHCVMIHEMNREELENAVDDHIKRTVMLAPFDMGTKQRILFLALGPAANLETPPDDETVQ